jgi:CDP-6-deoxy-D-xylo-4-hexulose-3-dehydrase
MNEIKLINDTINEEDIDALIKWLKTNPRLTKGELTPKFENEWSQWLGKKYSVFVNSGSSANLAMLYSLMLSNRLKNNKIILPSVSWATTITPAIHLGMEPILCECDSDTLGINIEHLAYLIDKHKPAVLMLVHILAFPCKMEEIVKLCKENDVILLEDSCESIGSTYNNIKTGEFGLMSSFSFYYGHHISTIEGGMISTDDKELYNLLLSVRSHGWDRDYDLSSQIAIRNKHGIDDFKGLFTFYYPGFNIRSTDLQAFIGSRQIEKIDLLSNIRNRNFKLYHNLINNKFWKIKDIKNCFYSNFAYPVISPNVDKIAQELKLNNIECRPLVCGSIGKQPFWIKKYGENNFDFANKVHDYGIYLPNHQGLNEQDIIKIATIVNKHT